MKKVITILASLVISTSCFIQAQECLWVKSAGSYSLDEATSVCTDVNGNVLMTGYFYGQTITFGTTTLNNADINGYSYDIFIVKYDASGNVLWANSAGGTDSDYSYSVSTDASGNIYIAGRFTSATITFGSTTLTKAKYDNFFIFKYDAGGNVLWAKSADGTVGDYGKCVSTDVSGNVYVSGTFISPTITFGSTRLTKANNTEYFSDIFITKYDPSGNVLWAKSIGDTLSYLGSGVSTDASGNVYVSGHFIRPVSTFDTTTLTDTRYFSEIFIAKYDANGNELWEKSVGDTGGEIGSSFSTDASGNVYMTGYFGGPTITFGSTRLTNADNTGHLSDIFITKYDPSGNVLWAKSIGATLGEVGRGISTDASGNVYVSGTFSSPAITFGATKLINTGYFSEIFIAKYDAAGNALWAIGGNVNDGTSCSTSVSTDASGNVYMSGHFSSPTKTFGSTTLTNVNTGGYFSDVFIAKYTGTGIKEMIGNKE